ncbi:MAG TPA: hypothetical protein VF311_04520 [Terriglobales bacterium]
METTDTTVMRVRARLRRLQMQVIAAGLALVEPKYLQAFADSCRPVRGTYDASFMALLRRIRREFNEQLQISVSSHRVSLDAVELAVCALGVRLADQAMRRDILPTPPGWSRRTRSRLLARLENLRKRAKRTALRCDPGDYAERQGRWRELCRWLRAQLEDKPITTPNQQRRRYTRQCLDIAAALAKRELQLDGVPLPPDRDLRRHVSLALRNIRREYSRPSIRDVLKRTLLAARYLATYVSRRLATLQDQPKTNSTFPKGFFHVSS